MKILDSDHCVAILRRQLDLRQHVLPQDELGVTAISVGELTHGARKSARPAENLARLDVLLSSLSFFPFDDIAARQFGRIKARLENEGQRLRNLDLQIAAIALEQQSPLVTHNRRHFIRIEGLRLEDWL